MILTFKVKHNRDFKEELIKAKQVAEYAIQNRSALSSKFVSFIGLKSAIANQILRKFGRNKKCKKITSVNLIVPSQSIRVENNTAICIPLKLNLDISYLPKFSKINQIELNSAFAFISVEVDEPEPFMLQSLTGLDRNTTEHIAVLANLDDGKTLKLGKSAQFIHRKYRAIRKRFQKKGLYSVVKTIKDKESRIIKDLNHKISRGIIDWCKENQSALVLEDLKGIRKAGNNKSKKWKGDLNSWSFYQLQMFLEYKAKLSGVSIGYIDPAYTSQMCSKCHHIGERNGKEFQCNLCGHVDHSDTNAAFNIAWKMMVYCIQTEMYVRAVMARLAGQQVANAT